MRIVFIYISFVTSIYAMETSHRTLKFDVDPLSAELFSIFVVALLITFLYIKLNGSEKFSRTYIKLVLVSLAGFLTAKTILFFQWYWIITPEHRNFHGDLYEGLYWNILFSILGSFVIFISYLIAIPIAKKLSIKI